MTKTKAKLRISGLVKLMNFARDRMRVGIPAGEAGEFRDAIRDAIRTVDNICRKEHLTPQDLPAPSRRAYAYLKSLDLKNLPIRDEDAPPPPQKVKISGAVAICNFYHETFASMVKEETHPWKAEQKEVRRIAAEMRGESAAIAAICEDGGGLPATLPTPSRRAYEWLTFLGEPENLALHLETLSRGYHIAQTSAIQHQIPAARRKLDLALQIYHTNPLFRTKGSGQTLDIALSEGFLGAPSKVLRHLMRAALLGGDAQERAMPLLRRYASGETFAEIMIDLEATTANVSTDVQGVYYNLREVFDRVNASYFEGAMEVPHFTWNRTLTFRKMGHYDTRMDRVMVSMSLDEASVPPYVIDYVMYHELLHKQLGVKESRGRRYAHTPAFREAERRFAEYEQARAFLAQQAGAS